MTSLFMDHLYDKRFEHITELVGLIVRAQEGFSALSKQQISGEFKSIRVVDGIQGNIEKLQNNQEAFVRLLEEFAHRLPKRRMRGRNLS